ncbi:conjugal transfer protein [Bacillus pumilus]|uniref:conjugal transfer protein n=1 Tax=Bacillus pumilus TaxID=1408 RepID=UPI0011A6CA15|nr:conjugal transfer protein [Bacillus pumilus]
MRSYNYKKTMNHPITLYKLGPFNLNFGISLVRGALFAAILLAMIAFRKFFLSIGSIMPGLTMVLYVGIPWLLSGLLVKQKYNGKKIHRFLVDFTNYFFIIYLPKRRYANDQEVLYSNIKQVTFEDAIIRRKDGDDGEIKDANQKRTRQSYADQIG